MKRLRGGLILDGLAPLPLVSHHELPRFVLVYAIFLGDPCNGPWSERAHLARKLHKTSERPVTKRAAFLFYHRKAMQR